MAWQVGSVCYSTEVAAASAAASMAGGAVVQHGSSAMVVGVEEVSASSITYRFSPIDGGTATVVVTAYAPQPCGLLVWSDGLQLGWLVAGVWLAVLGLQFLARGLMGEHHDRGDS